MIREQNGHFPTISGLTRNQPVSIGTENRMNGSQSKSSLAIAGISPSFMAPGDC